MLRSILTFFLLIYSFVSLSQNIKIIDASTKKSIENVYLYTKKTSTSTTNKGEANISSFSKDDIIVFQHPSFQNLHLTYKEIAENNFIVELTPQLFKINEITIAANKWEQNPNEVPVSLIQIDNRAIINSEVSTSADLLKESGQVFIQKSQMGGGSPMIRGFAANRVLIVLDGVRLNNAIYRSGNLQNLLNIDPNSLESAEVVLGPGSVIYGSDAIGGVMDFHTIKPKLSTDSSLNFQLNHKTKYASANHELGLHTRYFVGNNKWSYAGNISHSDYSDLKMGKNGSNQYDRNEYVIQENGEDQIVKNPDPYVQEGSKFDQLNIIQKLRYKVSANTELQYNFLYSTTSDIPRYDRLIQYSGDELKYAEWYYGPQKLQFHSLNIANKRANTIFDSFKLIAAYQNYKESRHSRKLNSDNISKRFEDLDIFSTNIDFNKKINDQFELFYGAEYLHNYLNSTGYKKNILNSATSPLPSRYPNHSSYSSQASYTNLKWKLHDRWTINGGLRYSHIWLKSKLDTEFYDFPFDDLDLNTGALNGSIGATLQTQNNYLLKLNMTTGFRAPNIDDIGKVFDSEPGKVIVPNKNLKPEYAYNFDFNISKNITPDLFIDINGFYSILKDAMVRRDFSFNGQTTLMYDGVESEVQAIVNDEKAIVYGFSLKANAQLTSNLLLNAYYNRSKGEYKDGSPVRHVPPTFASMALKYKSKKLKSRLSIEYNGEIANKDLADTEKDKAYMYAKDNNGLPYSPRWVSFNLNNSYQLRDKIILGFSIENIFDKAYRPYSSGISAPGRNFILSLSFEIK
ncbi:TonB-dependent receptor [Ancylomarina euxinus]|uniref:TonB-dependent receptor n=1 Tax=Ancylomarina euxinus TaxID=2283627 RepID=A0A425XWN7_9BACT|nr:TonB-dependent receptor [Ancylomarina euxinus]MCZ4696374.1 TonB-dependent receptor [Ancylomarina euxinus]MUP16781.1 TonB-dependent receptor plug domain-containing protein [Ancylomarina euxinus]RRG19059.1 TonB-dependent receptor [Ancylomarina euxinus]